MFLDLALFCKSTGKNRGVISVTTLGFMEKISQLGTPTISEIVNDRKEYQAVYAMIRKHEEWFEVLDENDTEYRTVGRPANRIRLSEEGIHVFSTALRAYTLGLFSEEIPNNEILPDGVNVEDEDTPDIDLSHHSTVSYENDDPVEVFRDEADFDANDSASITLQVDDD